jgi:hypothetical protein
MSIKVEKKKFTETFGFIKKLVTGIKEDKLQLIKYILYCFFFIFLANFFENRGANFDLSVLNETAKSVDITAIKQEQFFSIGENVLNSFLSFFVFGITSISFLFFKYKPNSLKKNMLHFFNYKFYFNFLFTMIFMFVFMIAVIIAFIPEPFLMLDKSSFNIEEVKKIFLGLTNSETTYAIVSLSVAALSMPFFLLGTIMGYMNVLDTDESILKTYFLTLGGVFKSFFFWVIPLTIYFLIIFTIYNNYIIVGIELDFIKVLYNSFLSSIFWGYGGYILFKLKDELYPEDTFDPIQSDKERIIAKHKN